VWISGAEPENQETDPCAALRRLLTCGLSGVTDFAPQDLYVTVGAGTPLHRLHEDLGCAGFQTALLSPWSQATVGGLLAANVNSPLRMRYGGLRDQALAMTIVAADGRIIHAGRPVVKNVAGYDLPKVMIGSFGALGLIADVTLKVFSLPRARRSLLVPVDDLELGVAWAQICLDSALVSTGIVLANMAGEYPALGTSCMLAFSAEGPAEDVKSELELIRSRLAAAGAARITEVDGAAAGELWAQFLGQQWNNRTLVRTGLPPRLLGRYLVEHAKICTRSFIADIASGLLYTDFPITGLAAAQAALAVSRHADLHAGGYAVVMASPPELIGQLDRWGYQPQTLELMRALKAHWDPAGILNPGVFLV